MSGEARGMDGEFFQVMTEAAEKTGFVISEVKEERCAGGGMLNQICETGAEYTGAVVIRLMPKKQPRQDVQAAIEAAKNQPVTATALETTRVGI